MRLPQVRPEIAVGVVFVAGMFLNILDSTIVNVALPALAADFGVSPARVDWIVLGYLLSLAVWIPASGWIGDRFGTKRTYLAALAFFVTASALCGIAQSLGQMIAFRILQGVGGGMLAPVGTAMLFRVFPPEKRAQASRVLILPTIVAPTVGPVLGGWLVDHASWRWCFYINLPVGVAAFVWGLLFVREHREETTGRFDLAGFLLSASGLSLTLFALSQGPSAGWTSPLVLTASVIGLAALAVLVHVELHRDDPMLDLRLLRGRLFRTANLTSLFGYGAFLGTLFAMPMFLQEACGFTAFQSGLTTFPEALGIVLSTQVASRVYPFVGPRRLMSGGLLVVAASLALLTLVEIQTSAWWTRLLMFTTGAGMANVFLSLQTATFAQVESRDMGHASAIFNAQRQVGGSLGVAVLSTVIASMVGHQALTQGHGLGPASLPAFHAAFLAGAAMAVVGACIAATVHDQDAARTLQPRPS